MKYKRTIQQVRMLAVLLCLAAFLVLNSIVHLQIRHYKNEEQLAATYTAEATVRRIEAQLNRYLSRSDLLKNIIESGVDIDESSYDDLCRYMLDSDGIIQAIELAPTVWSNRSIRWLTTSRPSASTLSMTRSAAKTPPWPKTAAGRPSTCSRTRRLALGLDPHNPNKHICC